MIKPIPCPCCGQMIVAPSPEIVAYHYHLTAREERILKAVWQGRGLPVKAGRIFDAMYEDDPDGGPSWSRMYNSLKEGLSRLRGKLRGSGIRIESAGRGQGYRLVLEGI